jgi:predicted peroxiredoxin
MWYRLSIVLVTSGLLLGTLAIVTGESVAQRSAEPTLVINLTSGAEDLHAVTMGLHFAEHGLAAGRQVVIFFNVKAPPLARKTLDDSVRFEDKLPVREMIQELVRAGAKMVVCPMCAAITGVEPDELTAGIEMIADREQIFDHLHAQTVVFTY